IGKNFPVTRGFVADPKLTLGKLTSELSQQMTTEQRHMARQRSAALGRKKEQELATEIAQDQLVREEIPLRTSRFMEELAAQLPSDAVIFDEALTCSPELVRYIPPNVPGQYYQTRGGSLGVGIPGAIGIKLAHPDKTVIGFTGDGGSMYTIQALWTAAHHHVDAKFVICNNHSYKLLKLNIQQYWRERGIPEHSFPRSFDLTTPDIQFAAMARSMGVEAIRVERPDEVAQAIRRALGHRGPFLIDLVLGSDVPGHISDCKCGQ
ncbi:MAG: thiamine pyrophosphate-binding protein, partial [Nitrososphaerota archaeon]|nr:thiamine pyrophosphate-binding protein [Nitrososphaerota archaeon]